MSTLNTTVQVKLLSTGFVSFPQKLNLFAVGSNHDFGAVSKGKTKKSTQINSVGYDWLIQSCLEIGGC